MSTRSKNLQIATAPFDHRGITTPKLMVEVLLATVPLIGAAAFYFGVSALLVIISAIAGAVVTERLLIPSTGGAGTLRDGSAVLTGVLIALTLPPSVPLWMAFLGGVAAISLGKAIWGGLGQNLFNPALVGRAFLQAAFPTAITTWTPPGSGFWDVPGSTFAAPLMSPDLTDVVTTASPLGMAKFDGVMTSLGPLLSGNTAGSLGETASIVLIAVGIILALRRAFDWRLPAATLVSVAVFSTVMHLINADWPDAAFMLTSGGLMFGAVFMVTDPVTTPITTKGAWIFGIGVGALVVLIRLFGGLPEGVMYSILLMNSVTPLIDRKIQPRRFGG